MSETDPYNQHAHVHAWVLLVCALRPSEHVAMQHLLSVASGYNDLHLATHFAPMLEMNRLMKEYLFFIPLTLLAGKLVALDGLLKSIIAAQERVVIVSTSTATLDTIDNLLLQPSR